VVTLVDAAAGGMGDGDGFFRQTEIRSASQARARREPASSFKDARVGRGGGGYGIARVARLRLHSASQQAS